MPRVTGLCGSSTVSHLAWCLRWMATHSLVTMPVVSHSQKRKKCDGMACSSSARCACARCRKIVTAAIVTCVAASVNSTTCHQDACSRPSASHCTSASCTIVSTFHSPILAAPKRGPRIVGARLALNDGLCGCAPVLLPRSECPGWIRLHAGCGVISAVARPRQRSRRSGADAATAAAKGPSTSACAPATCAAASTSAAGNPTKSRPWSASKAWATAWFSAASRLQVA
jgi:hypothetical protein